MSGPLTREDAIERLARQLYEDEYRLDPPAVSENIFIEWPGQTEYVKGLYREMIENLLLNREALECALYGNGQPPP